MQVRLFDRIMPQALHSGRLPMHLVPILIVGYSCLLPREFNLEIQDAAFFPYRIALILSLPLAVARLAQSPVRPSIIDALAAFVSAWFVISLMYTTSFKAGIQTGTSYAMDYGLAYLLGRASVRSAEDMRQIFRYFLPGVLLVVAILAVESISHRNLLRPVLANLLGQPEPILPYNVRFGLLRATGPFPHPILSGVFLAGTLPLAWYATHTPRLRLLGLMGALGAIFTVSSTAMIGLLIASGLIMMDIMQRLSRLPIFLLAGAYFFLMLLVILLGSESGLLNFLVRNLTFDPNTGYYRMWIWEYGGAEALANPLFGIGLRDWIRPEEMYSNTVDAYWLLITMLHGFPVLVATALVMLGTVFSILVTQRHRHPADRDVGMAIVQFIVIAIISGFTVHLWEALNSWILMIIGCGVSLASQARQVPVPVWQTPQPWTPDISANPVTAQ